MLKLIMKTDIIADGASVEMFSTNCGYAVRYGLQVDSNLTICEAKAQYDNCIGHALGCSGLLDDDYGFGVDDDEEEVAE
tara:strand:- start:314 stop:550 length:237 start_codon:yes stop_codon:yes gene_type:complete